MSPRHIAIIPARGGSKGVPRKNVRLVGGIPLVSHVIRAAVGSGAFADVVVSTDDEEIARVAGAEGASIVVRPAELGADATPTEPVMEHALAAVERRSGQTFRNVWLLQPTSPLMTAADLRAASALFEESGADSLLSVCEDHAFFWSPVRGDDGREWVGPSYDPARRPRRQDMPARYRENGAMYAIRRGLWEDGRVRVAGRTIPYVMPVDRSVEVDSEQDIALVEALLQEQRAGIGRLGFVPQAVVFDFDGVFTDNGVLVTEDGRESVRCDRGDGMGIGLLRSAGLKVVVLSTEANPVVRQRCDKLRIECRHDLDDKAEALKDWASANGVDLERTVYVGNDVNDLGCMALVGYSMAPQDAHRTARAAASEVLSAIGGHGAVREACDRVIEAKDHEGGGKR